MYLMKKPNKLIIMMVVVTLKESVSMLVVVLMVVYFVILVMEIYLFVTSIQIMSYFMKIERVSKLTFGIKV